MLTYCIILINLQEGSPLHAKPSQWLPAKSINVHSRQRGKCDPINKATKNQKHPTELQANLHLSQTQFGHKCPEVNHIVSTTEGLSWTNVNPAEWYTAPRLVYEFSYNYSDTRVGRIVRRPTQRMSEHIPKCLDKSALQIAKYFITTKHSWPYSLFLKNPKQYWQEDCSFPRSNMNTTE